MTQASPPPADSFAELVHLVRSDFRRNCKPGLWAAASGLWFNVALQVVLSHRLHRFLSRRRFFKLSLLQLMLANWQVSRGNCQLSPRARIGAGLLLPHPLGVVVGNGCVIGDNVTLYQNVTIGNDGRGNTYPTLEDGVKVFASSSVIGAVVIGEGAVIGAHSLVRCSVPALGTAYGVPARVRVSPPVSPA